MPTALACPACHTGLLARRGDPLCPTCVKAAREVAVGPLWVFDSLLLREALAQMNMAAVPAIVRAACGLSQRDLAAITGWNPATLSYYERGQRDGMFDVRTVLHFADAVGMPRTALLPLVFADADARLGSVEAKGKGLSRPGLDGPASASGPPTALTVVDAPGRASGSHARYWQACANVLYARDQSVSGDVLLPLAMQQWQRAQQATARDDSAGETGIPLLAAAGELALCTGWIAMGVERLTLARHLYEEARELAVGAGDVTLAVHALAGQSMLHAELAKAGSGRAAARQALRLAYQAADEGRYVPLPPLQALIALRHASAASLLGDKAASLAAIGRARRELGRSPGSADPPQRLRFVCETEITETEAACYLDLGEAARSAALYRQLLDGELTPGQRAGCWAGLAGALLRQGANQDAVAAAAEVLPALERGVPSTRYLSRLRPVRRVADSIDSAQGFRDRFDTAARALAAICDPPDGEPGQLRDESLASSVGCVSGRPCTSVRAASYADAS